MAEEIETSAQVTPETDVTTETQNIDSTEPTDSTTSQQQTEETLPEGAPESYEDFTVPEGMTFDKESASDFLDLAKELNLTQGQAQKLVDQYGSRITAQAQAQQEAQQKEVEQLIKECKKTHGKEGIEEAKQAREFLLSQGKITQKFYDLMENPLIGNNPEMVGILRMIRTDTKEGGFINGGTPSNPNFYPGLPKGIKFK